MLYYPPTIPLQMICVKNYVMIRSFDYFERSEMIKRLKKYKKTNIIGTKKLCVDHSHLLETKFFKTIILYGNQIIILLSISRFLGFILFFFGFFCWDFCNNLIVLTSFFWDMASE